MDSAVDRALKIVNDNYSIICQGHQEVMAIVITQALKEQDKITRHTCAENVSRIESATVSGFPTPKILDGCIVRGEAHSVIMNTKSV